MAVCFVHTLGINTHLPNHSELGPTLTSYHMQKLTQSNAQTFVEVLQLKPVEENMRKYSWPWATAELIRYNTKSMIHKRNIDKVDFIKIKKCEHFKDM